MNSKPYVVSPEIQALHDEIQKGLDQCDLLLKIEDYRRTLAQILDNTESWKPEQDLCSCGTMFHYIRSLSLEALSEKISQKNRLTKLGRSF